MPSFVPGKQVHHRLGHDMRGRVAHRVERICPARSASSSSSADSRLGASSASSSSSSSLRLTRFLVDCHLGTLRESKDLSSIDRTRGRASRGSTRLRPCGPTPRRRSHDAALTGGARTGSPIAHGWYTSRRLDRPGFQPTDPGSLRSRRLARVSRSTLCLCGAEYTTLHRRRRRWSRGLRRIARRARYVLVPVTIVLVMAVTIVDVIRVAAALHRLVATHAVMPMLVATVFLVLVHVGNVVQERVAWSQAGSQAWLAMSFQVG